MKRGERRFSAKCVSIFLYRTAMKFKTPTKITEPEFAKICGGIDEDREIIRQHNPIGETMEETLLWMLMSCLHSYLSLTELETPCFSGKPNAETYRDAILFILKDRKTDDFEAEKYLEQLSEK